MRKAAALLVHSVLLIAISGCGSGPKPFVVVPVLVAPSAIQANASVSFSRNVGTAATPAFSFTGVPAPTTAPSVDVARSAVFSIVTGSAQDSKKDPASGPLTVLNDGLLPQSGSDPTRNFFFRNGIDSGGRILITLPKATKIAQFNTYSWSTGPGGPQRYTLYGLNGSLAAHPAPPNGVDPATAGWTMIGTPINTTALVPLLATEKELSVIGQGGQYGVTFSSTSLLGTFQYLLMVVSQTDTALDNTYYSEVTIIEAPSDLELIRRRNEQNAAQP